MALAFSLLAALLVILVQQWVCKYMHVFQRYGDPLKSSRLQQYLYEGCEKWCILRVAEAVPGFPHISLFLFLQGLATRYSDPPESKGLSITVTQHTVLYYMSVNLTEEVKEIVRGQEYQISELEQINIEADRLGRIDRDILAMQYFIDSSQIISQFPGVPNVPFSRFFELSRDPRKLQFICPGQTPKSLCSPALALRNILEGQGDADGYKESLKNLEVSPLWAVGGEKRCSDSCGVCRICAMEAGLALQSTFLPCLRAAFIHISIEGISLCTVHGHISGHYI